VGGGRRSSRRVRQGRVEMADLALEVLKGIHAELRGVNTRLDRMDERFERMDQRFERMDQRFERVDQRFDRAESRIDGVEAGLAEIAKRQTSMEVRLATEIVAVVGAIHELRDVLVADRGVRQKVEDHEVRLLRLERR
jgi:chromosome segregation ATPase